MFIRPTYRNIINICVPLSGLFKFKSYNLILFFIKNKDINIRRIQAKRADVPKPSYIVNELGCILYCKNNGKFLSTESRNL